MTTDDEGPVLVSSSSAAIIHAPLDQVDLPAWCFGLPEAEYRACSPAHCSVGTTTAPDGRRMSINVESIGGTLMVQHYVEEIGTPGHLRLVSISDVFTPTGRTSTAVTWDLRVTAIDASTCELLNTVHSTATRELLHFLGSQGMPWEAFRSARREATVAHNRQETPHLAQSIERHALRSPRSPRLMLAFNLPGSRAG